MDTRRQVFPDTIRKASIHLRSIINGETTENYYIGEYRRKDGSHCIAYTDYVGNAVTKVGIEARENAMLLHRVGAITSDMLFDPAEDTVMDYDALALRSGFVLRTHDYRIMEGNECLMLYAEYSLHDESNEPPIRGTQEIWIYIKGDEDE